MFLSRQLVLKQFGINSDKLLTASLKLTLKADPDFTCPHSPRNCHSTEPVDRFLRVRPPRTSDRSLLNRNVIAPLPHSQTFSCPELMQNGKARCAQLLSVCLPTCLHVCLFRFPCFLMLDDALLVLEWACVCMSLHGSLTVWALQPSKPCILIYVHACASVSACPCMCPFVL